MSNYFKQIYSEEIPHRAIAVYMYLRYRADKDGKCFPAINTISKELKLSRSTIKRAIQDLEKSGYLTRKERWRENGGRSSNMYYIK